MDAVLDLRELAQLLEFFGSTCNAEVMLAGRRAHEMIREAGLSWEALLVAGHDPRAHEDVAQLRMACDQLFDQCTELQMQLARLRERQWVEPTTIPDKISRCGEHAESLSVAERDFVRDLIGRSSLTAQQHKRLDRLVEKLWRLAQLRSLNAADAAH